MEKKGKKKNRALFAKLGLIKLKLEIKLKLN